MWWLTNVFFEDTKTSLRLITFKRQNVTPFVITSTQAAILGGNNVIFLFLLKQETEYIGVQYIGLYKTNPYENRSYL